MKAALFEKPHQLSVISKELRKLRNGEILVKVEACGVCGTDVHIVEGTSHSTPPVVLGHEYAGIIEDVARDVIGFKPGQRVAIDPNITCGACFFCRRGEVNLCSNLKALGVDIDGGMAQYCIVPQLQVFALPEDFPQEASVFIEPVSCVLHGFDRANVKAGDTVLILGAGTIGLMMLQVVKHGGAARTIVIEPLEHKRLIASKLNADEVVNPTQNDCVKVVRELTGVGADVVIECAGNIQTAQLAVELARRGGTVEFFGVCPIGETMTVEPNQIYSKELKIVGSHVNPHTFSRAISVLQSGIVRTEEFQINRFSLDDVHEALRYQREGKTVKSIIMPFA